MKRRRKQMTTLDYMRQNVKWGMLAFAIIFVLGIFIGPGFGSYGSLQCGKDKAPQTREEYLMETSPVLAKLGDEEFKEFNIGREYNQRLEYYKSQTPTGTIVPPEDLIGLKWSVLDANIENKIKLQKAKEQGIKIDNAEVNKQFDEIKRNAQKGADQQTQKNLSLLQRTDLYIQGKKAERDFIAMLHQMGLSPEKLKENIKENLMIQKFDENLENEAKEEVKEETRKKAITIFNSINTEGKSFEEVAKAESNDSASASKGGLVENYLRKDAKSKGDAYATALFTSEIGKVQEPIETEDGFYIVKVEKRVIAEGAEFENVKAGIIEELKKELGIEDESKTDPKAEASSEQTADTPPAEEPAETTTEESDKPKITDDMIKERFENVTFKQIYIRPDSHYTRVNDKIEAIKKEAGIEIIDPTLKAYSYVAGVGEYKDFDKAIEGFKVVRQEKLADVEKAKTELKQKESELNSANDNNRAELETQVRYAEDSVGYANSELAQANYLVSHFMDAKIQDANQKRMQEFFEKKQKEPELYKDAQMPDASPEEQAMIKEYKAEMLTLMEEAVSILSTPEPYYNALLGDLYVENKEWTKAHEQWAIVVDYVSGDANLLNRAQSAYNAFMDNITDSAVRETVGKEFDKLSKNLEKAMEKQRQMQEEQQKQWQKMMEEQMKTEGS